MLEKEEKEASEIQKKASLNIPILKATQEDEEKVKEMTFKTITKPQEDLLKRKKEKILVGLYLWQYNWDIGGISS